MFHDLKLPTDRYIRYATCINNYHLLLLLLLIRIFIYCFSIQSSSQSGLNHKINQYNNPPPIIHSFRIHYFIYLWIGFTPRSLEGINQTWSRVKAIDGTLVTLMGQCKGPGLSRGHFRIVP